MKVLVVGSGGREHALCWKIAQSELVDEVLALPGNPGTAAVGRNVGGVDPEDVVGVVRVAREEEVELVVIGPEGPLCAGLADGLRSEGIAVFGPGKAGAQLEGSKLFAKELLDRHRIPTGAWKRFDRAGAAKDYLENLKVWPIVIKADGLAAGKGVFVVGDSKEACHVVDQVMEERQLGEAGCEILIEEFLVGQEVSIHVVTDGTTLLVLDSVEDHKQVGEGDTGPNTGGMGVASPVGWLGRRLMRQIEQRILIPMLHALRIESIPFQGLLYAGLMITEGGPKVLEFNCRFGDPETQAIMRRFKSDLVPYLLATAKGELDSQEPPLWDKRHCVGIVMCAEGYPGKYKKGDVIHGIGRAEELGDEAVVFQAGTKSDGPDLLTNGGRVLCVTGLGEGVDGARDEAFAAVERIRWDGAFWRKDIGKRPVTISTGA
jgi:phosphoribosylamine--glycine ligase